jgi:hypothetical protein
MDSGSIFPSPTATSVPTRLRTIWWRKESAFALMTMCRPRTVTVSSRRVRTVLAGSFGARQNDAKSCSPISSSAARRMASTSSGPGRCQANRAVNGSRTEAVSIRYRYSRPVALRLASNVEGALLARTTTTSGPSIPLTARWIRDGSTARVAAKDATCPSACTPASVRPATESDGRSRRMRSRASSRTPSTVRTPGCLAHPRKSVPSYASISLMTRGFAAAYSSSGRSSMRAIGAPSPFRCPSFSTRV